MASLDLALVSAFSVEGDEGNVRNEHMGGMWFSGHGILRSKGGHWGNIKRGGSQQTESSMCCAYLHTHGSTVGVCVGHVSGWEQQPAGRRDHQEQAENVFTFFSHICYFILTRERRWWERDAVAVRWNQWQKQSLMHGTVGVLHSGGLESFLHPILLPHGDDAPVVTTGRCHFARIFFLRLWFDALNVLLQKGTDGWAGLLWMAGKNMPSEVLCF